MNEDKLVKIFEVLVKKNFIEWPEYADLSSVAGN